MNKTIKLNLEKQSIDDVSYWVGDSEYGHIELCHCILRQLPGVKGEEIILNLQSENTKGSFPVRIHKPVSCWNWEIVGRDIKTTDTSDYFFSMRESAVTDILEYLFPGKYKKEYIVWVKIVSEKD